MKRLVVTIARGKPKFAQSGLGLGRSLKLIGDTTRRVAITDQTQFPWLRSFDEILHPEGAVEQVFFSKLTMLERSDADQVLFVDADSLAFKRLGPIFDYCQGKGLVVSGKLIREGQWHGNVADHCRRHGIPALPQFNGGLIYYERTPDCQSLIQMVMEYGKHVQELGFGDYPILVDEPCIALAMAKSGLGHLAPDEMDWSNTAVGLIGPLRLDVMRNECSFVCRRYGVRFVAPFLFHAARYSDFLIYWRELAKLEHLESIEHTRQYGYIPPFRKLQRSIEKRFLKYIARKL